MSDEIQISSETNQPPTIPASQERFTAFLTANNDWPQMNIGIQAVMGDAMFRNPPHDFSILLSEHMTDHQVMVAQLSLDQRHRRVGVAYRSELKKAPNDPHVVFQSRLKELYVGQRNEVLARALAFLSGESLTNSAELSEEHVRRLTELWHDPATSEDVAFLQAAYSRMASVLHTPPAQKWARLHQDIEVEKHRKKLTNEPWKISLDRVKQVYEGPGAILVAQLDEETQHNVSRDISLGNVEGVIGTILELEIRKLAEEQGKTYPSVSIRVITRGGMPPMSARMRSLMNLP